MYEHWRTFWELEASKPVREQLNCHRPTHKYDYEFALFISKKAVGKTLWCMRSHNSEKAYTQKIFLSDSATQTRCSRRMEQCVYIFNKLHAMIVYPLADGFKLWTLGGWPVFLPSNQLSGSLCRTQVLVIRDFTTTCTCTCKHVLLCNIYA